MSSPDPNLDRSLTARINLYYDLHLPASGPAPLLIALHGYGANKRQMMREAQQMAPAGFNLDISQEPVNSCVSKLQTGGIPMVQIGWFFLADPFQGYAHR